MLISRVLVGVRAFPAWQIPDFEAAPSTDERDLAFQFQFAAKIIRQEETALFVCGAVLRAGVEMAQKNSQIARGNVRHVFGRGADPREFVGRHDEQKLVVRFRHHEELFRLAVAAPARGNGEPMFVIELMTKFSRVEIRY